MISFDFEREIFYYALELFKFMEVVKAVYVGALEPSKINIPGHMPTIPVSVIKRGDNPSRLKSLQRSALEISSQIVIISKRSANHTPCHSRPMALVTYLSSVGS